MHLVGLCVFTALLLFYYYIFKLDVDFISFFSLELSRDYFKGKVIWITGASQGLGRLLAIYFAKKGARLILSSRNLSKLKSIEKECINTNNEKQKNTYLLPFDLTDSAKDIKLIVNKALQAFDHAGPDIIIHNAGISQHSPAAETDAEIVKDIFALNTMGPIMLTQALIPELLKRGKGHFVVISSMAAKIPSPGQAIYCATKYAILGYFETLKAELADTPIKVTVCCPGPMKSEKNEIRHVYGNCEIVAEKGKDDKKRQDPNRIVKIINIAIQNNLTEAWIAKQPILFLGHIMQYMPVVGHFLLQKFGPKRSKSVKSGEGYSILKMFTTHKKKA